MSRHYIMIIATTAILLLITFGDMLGFSAALIFLLVLAGQVMLVLTVIAILKAPRVSDKTFEDYFYEDGPRR